MAKKVLIKPMITEKSSALIDDQNKYTFKVDKGANKVEIKKAVEVAYNVAVEDVKTMIMPSKAKVRNTKRGVQRGRKSCLLYTSPSPRDATLSRMPSSA